MQIRHSNSFLKIPIAFSLQQKTASTIQSPASRLVTQPRLHPSQAQCLGNLGHVSLSAEVRLRYSSMIGCGEVLGAGPDAGGAGGGGCLGGRLGVGFDPRR